MISGTVNSDREAVIRLVVRGPTGQEQEIEALVDTGFDGFLTLSPALIEALDLVWLERGRLIMADGGEEFFDIYEAAVEWDGRFRRVAVDAVDADPILGMSLLDGYELNVRVQASDPPLGTPASCRSARRGRRGLAVIASTSVAGRFRRVYPRDCSPGGRMMAHTEVSADFRVPIPEEIRRVIPLRPGQSLGIVAERGVITLVPEQVTDDRPSARTLEHLAAAHGVEPAESYEKISGGWPEDELDDGFEEAVRRWRDDELRHEG